MQHMATQQRGTGLIQARYSPLSTQGYSKLLPGWQVLERLSTCWPETLQAAETVPGRHQLDHSQLYVRSLASTYRVTLSCCLAGWCQSNLANAGRLVGSFAACQITPAPAGQVAAQSNSEYTGHKPYMLWGQCLAGACQVILSCMQRAWPAYAELLQHQHQQGSSSEQPSMGKPESCGEEL